MERKGTDAGGPVTVERGATAVELLQPGRVSGTAGPGPPAKLACSAEQRKVPVDHLNDILREIVVISKHISTRTTIVGR